MTSPASIDEREELWRHTSMRVGGPARYFAAPCRTEEADALLAWAADRSLPYVILGAGTNVIFPDSGYAGLVVHTGRLRGVVAEERMMHAAAGESLADVAWQACRLGLAGLEWACGIPGSVGGAVVMNAGTRDGETSEVLSSARMVRTDGTTCASARDLALGYRTSALRTGRLEGVITEVSLRLSPSDPDQTLGRARALLSQRQAGLPAGASVGCTFRNPLQGPPAGQLLDQAGCKKLRVGDACVSDVHANFIINEGTRNAGDVLRLVEQMKQRVLDTFGVTLEEEVVVYR